MKGLPKLIDASTTDESNDESLPMDISAFSNAHLTMEVFEGSKVSFRYMFRDSRGIYEELAGWEALVETQCQRFEAIQDAGIHVPETINLTKPSPGLYRWVRVEHPEPMADELHNSLVTTTGADSRHKGVELCESDPANLRAFIC